MYETFIRLSQTVLSAAMAAQGDSFRCRPKKDAGAGADGPMLEGVPLRTLVVRLDDSDVQSQIVDWCQDAACASWPPGWRVSMAGLLAGQELPAPARRSVPVTPTAPRPALVDVAPLLQRASAEPSAGVVLDHPSPAPAELQRAQLQPSLAPTPLTSDAPLSQSERAAYVSANIQLSEQIVGMSGAMLNLLRENRLIAEAAMTGQRQASADVLQLARTLTTSIQSLAESARDSAALVGAQSQRAADERAQSSLEYALEKAGEAAELRASARGLEARLAAGAPQPTEDQAMLEAVTDLGKTFMSLKTTGAPPAEQAVPFLLRAVAQGDPKAVFGLRDGLGKLSASEQRSVMVLALEAMGAPAELVDVVRAAPLNG